MVPDDLSRDELLARNESLEVANQLRTQFINTVSHELQTPLVAITGLTEILGTEWAELPDAERRDYVAAIDRQARRLQGLVRDLLTTTGLQAGTIRPSCKVVPLAATALRVRNELGTDLHLRCIGDLRVRVDPDHLHQIVTKLVSNACRYGEPPVRFEAREADGGIVFSVRDRGPGVDPDFVPEMFEVFRQARHHADRTEGSTGLGLTIVKGLIDANGGRISYRKAIGGGAQFDVWFPKP